MTYTLPMKEKLRGRFIVELQESFGHSDQLHRYLQFFSLILQPGDININ